MKFRIFFKDFYTFLLCFFIQSKMCVNYQSIKNGYKLF